ncbi:MAG: hypothetical protein HYY00_07485 [Chloroflexi bacterium]|nr:hypothetical protein [Chloroflexota bacterium]
MKRVIPVLALGLVLLVTAAVLLPAHAQAQESGPTLVDRAAVCLAKHLVHHHMMAGEHEELAALAKKASRAIIHVGVLGMEMPGVELESDLTGKTVEHMADGSTHVSLERGDFTGTVDGHAVNARLVGLELTRGGGSFSLMVESGRLELEVDADTTFRKDASGFSFSKMADGSKKFTVEDVSATLVDGDSTIQASATDVMAHRMADGSWTETVGSASLSAQAPDKTVQATLTDVTVAVSASYAFTVTVGTADISASHDGATKDVRLEGAVVSFDGWSFTVSIDKGKVKKVDADGNVTEQDVEDHLAVFGKEALKP